MVYDGTIKQIEKVGNRMKKTNIFVGKLIGYEKRNNSVNGNPKYYGVFESTNGDILRGTTATDASCGYSFLNKVDATKEIVYHTTQTGNVIIDAITF